MLGYVFLLSGVRDVPRDLARVNLKGDGTKKPEATELTVDATVSQRGDYAHIKGLSMDRSSHMSGGKPIGGNVLFEHDCFCRRDCPHGSFCLTSVQAVLN